VARISSFYPFKKNVKKIKKTRLLKLTLSSFLSPDAPSRPTCLFPLKNNSNLKNFL
jgi:hypothetical protein